MGFIQERADSASERLAGERGSFPNWERSVYGPLGWNRPMRNATRTTIAPTGTISIIAGTSSGIEPLFALVYHRKVLDGRLEVHPVFRRAAEQAGVWSEEMVVSVTARQCPRHPGSPWSRSSVFVTARTSAPTGMFVIRLRSSVTWTTRCRRRSTSPTMQTLMTCGAPTARRRARAEGDNGLPRRVQDVAGAQPGHTIRHRSRHCGKDRHPK